MRGRRRVSGFVLSGRRRSGAAQAVEWRGVEGANEGAKLASFGAGAMRLLRERSQSGGRRGIRERALGWGWEGARRGWVVVEE